MCDVIGHFDIITKIRDVIYVSRLCYLATRHLLFLTSEGIELNWSSKDRRFVWHTFIVSFDYKIIGLLTLNQIRQSNSWLLFRYFVSMKTEHGPIETKLEIFSKTSKQVSFRCVFFYFQTLVPVNFTEQNSPEIGENPTERPHYVVYDYLLLLENLMQIMQSLQIGAFCFSWIVTCWFAHTSINCLWST